MINKMRLSSYVIPVNLEKEPDKCLLIHGYAGSIDIIDKDWLDVLLHNRIGDDMPFDKDVVETLLRRGYLTTKTEVEEYEYVNRFAQLLHRKVKQERSAFTFVVTYDCNFRCPYCFERSLISDKHKMCFTMEKVDQAYDAIQFIQPNNKLRVPRITLFGGEPLLKENREVVSYIVEKGKRLGFKFNAVTNGYDLDSYMDLLALDSIDNLQITIDGTEEVHNQKRIHSQGYPTFHKIVANIGKALERDIFIVVRFNTDKTNINELYKLKKIFDDLGYTAHPKFTIDSARLIDYNKEKDIGKNAFFTPKEFISQHGKLGFEYGCHDFGAYNKIYRAIINQEPLRYKSIFCASQAGGYVLDPLGNIYACWDVVGREKFIIGTYSAQSVQWNTEMRDKWQKNNVMQYEKCKTCKCALLCGGGCTAHNMDKHRCNQMLEIIKYASNRAYNNYKLKLIKNGIKKE